MPSPKQAVSGKLARTVKTCRIAGLTMAAAKDFNDHLTFMVNNAEVALSMVEDGDPLRAIMQDLQRDSLACATISRTLMLLAKKEAGI
jgi:hypothetical protein